MSSSNNRPKWWQLYLTVPLLIGLFLLDARLKLSQRGHIAMQLGSLLLVYGLVHVWLKANATELASMDMHHYHGNTFVYRIPASRPPGAKSAESSLFHLPGPEIKGVLGNTFEMDYIDAEAFPVDEILHEIKKE